MNRHENRCANSEALARYERLMEMSERAYEERCEEMYSELEDEAKEYMKDMI